jgi:hypothetical protein
MYENLLDAIIEVYRKEEGQVKCVQVISRTNSAKRLASTGGKFHRKDAKTARKRERFVK